MLNACDCHMTDCPHPLIQVDLETFLTMTEEDLKEVGVSTLGARRKLQIASTGNPSIFLFSCGFISSSPLFPEIRKLQQQQEQAVNKKRFSSSIITSKPSSFLQSGGKLYPGYLSRSGRF